MITPKPVMRLADVRRLVESVSLETFSLPIRFELDLCPYSNSYRLRASIMVPDRDTLEFGPVILAKQLDMRNCDVRFLEHFMFGMATELLIHELREHWKVSGVRTRDPHAGEKHE